MTTTDAIERTVQGGERPAHELLWGLTNAGVASRCLHVVANLGVADRIGDEPVPIERLASACGADADGLRRVLRLLVEHGVFTHENGAYGHTDASRMLCTDHPMSMRDFPRMMGLPVFLQSFARLDHSVATGSPSLDLQEPNGLWAYLQAHPAELEIFERSMTAKAHADVAAVLESYDFSPYRRIADIAGGDGHLIEAVLGAYEDAAGVLFELPAVAERVAPSSRLDVVSGDFFVDPLPACDAYLLMNIVHDWDDDQALAILRAVANAGQSSASRVLIVETVMPEGAEPHWAKTLDVIMLAVTGGRERTEAEYRRLLGAAGIDFERTIPTRTPFSIVEANVRTTTKGA